MSTHILINNEPKSVAATSIQQLAEELELPSRGVALAVNNIVIPRTSWSDTILKEADSVTIIKAAFGG